MRGEGGVSGRGKVAHALIAYGVRPRAQQACALALVSTKG